MRAIILFIACIVCCLSSAVDEEVIGKPSLLWMDMEWVLQVSTFQFDGFFIEVLGLAESLHKSFPLLRLVKSSYRKKYDEPPIEPKSSLLEDLFVEERDVLNKLISTSFNPADLSDIQSPISMFSRQDKPIVLECIDHSTDTSKVQAILESPKLSKFEVRNVQSISECCRYCQQSPFCSYYVHNMTSGGCMLKSAHKPISSDVQQIQSAPLPTTPTLTNIQVGSVQPRNISPRAIIFHGTLCVYENITLPRRRDINTIYIGRYMIERSVFSKGLTMGDYATLYCAGLMDELWVPTEWHKRVMTLMLERVGGGGSGGGHPSIVVVPEAVDTNLFDRSLESELVISSKKQCELRPILSCRNEDDHKVPFVFLSVFKWEERKGWDILLNAYWKAFSKDDDVILLIHSHLPPPHTQGSDLNKVISDYAMRVFETSIDNLAAVHWLDNLNNVYHPRLTYHIGWHRLVSSKAAFRSNVVKAGLTRRQVRQLYAISDAFVLPTRGEGWGLPIAEAMAMELPVIVTNYSGPTAYADSSNSYPIPVEDYLDDMSYAIPKEDELVTLFKQVVLDSLDSSISKVNGGVCSNIEDCRGLDQEDTDMELSVAQMKGRRARQRMREFNSSMIVSIMQDRLRKQAERRGWHFPV